MQQEIRFKGLSLAGDEMAAKHGELALCAGVEMNDGALRPSILSGTYPYGDTALTGELKYVHKTASYTHYITVKKTTVNNNEEYTMLFYDAGSTTAKETDVPSEVCKNIMSVESIGNTLLLLTSEGVHYVLYKLDETTNPNQYTYKYLGNQIPFVRLQFSLSENKDGVYDLTDVTPDGGYDFPSQDAFRKIDSINENSFNFLNNLVKIKKDSKSDISEGVWALINKTNDTITKDGHFYAPFFVRYCYRLYDGSMVMHSAPVFMNVAQPRNHKVYASNIAIIYPSVAGADMQYKNSIDLYIDQTHKIAVDGFTARYTPNNVALMFKAVDIGADSEWQKLKTNWGDIVKSIDIFLTPQIVREKSDELISQIINEDKQSGIRDNQITEWESLWLVIPPKTSVKVRHKVIFDIPMLSDKDYVNKISSTSTFFKVKSITLDDTLSSTFQELDLDKSVVQNLTAQEQMKDDYKTHNHIIPYGENAGMYIYNHRLNLSGISEKLFSGFRIADMVNTTDYHPLGEYDDYPKADIKEVWVKIDTESGMKYVMNKELRGISLYVKIHEYALSNAFLFYPDSRAKKMFIKYDDGNEKWLELEMEPCPLLNGAFVIPNFFSKTFPTPITAPSLTVKDESPMPNRIYTSEVDNPYYFPPEGINNIGTGEIIGLAATTRALSQGQFGQFPLMAFCTDGVWALDVASSGTYSNIHPISREVCVNKASICQLDQSVAFATAKGLARVAESSVVSMSEQLDGPMVELITTTPASELLPGLYSHFNEETADDAEIRSFLSFTTHPKDFFKSGRLLYDFANARIIILPSTLDPSPSTPITPITAYVLSLRDMAWSTMHLPALRAAINAYPHPYLQETNGKVMVLDKTYDYIHNVRVPSIIVTRTMSFAATMQVIQGFQQLSNCIKDYPPLMFIYGSNDNVNWYYVGKTQKQQANYLPGHPFRFFRLAIYMKMRPTEKYQTLILDVIEKYQKL